MILKTKKCLDINSAIEHIVNEYISLPKKLYSNATLVFNNDASILASRFILHVRTDMTFSSLVKLIKDYIGNTDFVPHKLNRFITCLNNQLQLTKV